MDRVRLLRLLPLAALLLVGCRNDPFTVQYIEEVNNQNRQLEDIIYEQDYQLNVLKQELEDLKNRADYLKSERRRPAPRRPLDAKQPPAMSPEMDLSPPTIEMNPADVPPPVAPPRVVPEEPSAPRAIPEDPLPPQRRRTPPPMDPPVNPAPMEEPPARPRGNEFKPPAEPEPRVPTPPLPPIGPTSLPTVETLPKIEPEAPPTPPAVETLPATRPAVESLPPPPRSPPLKQPSQMLETRLDPPPSPGPEISPQIPPSIATTTGDEPPAPPAEVAQLAKAVSLFLHPLYTGGEDTDGRPGDEGLSVLIEPRSDSGEFIPAVGKVSLALLDPTQQGDAARVARWDFDADYVRRRLKTLTTQRGILLHTVWTDGPPKSNRLKLFVRLETEAGEKLETQREVFVALPGQLSNRWTPRTASGEPAEVARQPGAAVGDRITGDLAPEQKLPTQLAPLPPKPEFKPEPQPEIPTRKDRPKKGLIVPPAALGESP